MYYAVVIDNAIKGFGSLGTLFPASSFPGDGPNEQFMIENNLVVASQSLPINTSTHRLEYCDPYLLDGVVYYVKSSKLTAAQAKASAAAIAEFEGMQGEN